MIFFELFDLMSNVNLRTSIKSFKTATAMDFYSLARLRAIGVGVGRGWGVTKKDNGTAGMREKESGRDTTGIHCD